MRNRLKLLGGALLGAALLYWFARDLDGPAVLATIRSADWRLLALAVFLTMATYFVRALRWRTLLEPVCPGTTLSSLFAATSLGFAAVFLFGRAGEIVRPVALSSKEHIRPSASFATILIERVFDMLTVVAIFAVDLLVFTAPRADAETTLRIRWSGATLLGIAVASILGLTLLRRHRVGALDFLDRHLARFGRRIRKGVVNLVGNFAEALSVLHDVRELVVISGYSILLWGMCASIYWLTFAAFGMNLSAGAAVFVLGFGLVGSLVPTPGGAAGAFHMATAGGMILLGMMETDAKSIAIILHLIVFGSALPLGIYYLLRGGYSYSRLRAALSEDLNSISDIQNPIGYEPTMAAVGPADELKADR